MPGKKQKFGEAKSPFEMKGSPHKLGTIEGTSAFKARFTVEQTRTTGDAAIVGAASELGSSYVPGAIDYGLDVGFKTKDKEEKKKTDTKEETTEETTEKPNKKTRVEQIKNTLKRKPGKRITAKEQQEKNLKARKKSMSDISWIDYLKTGDIYE